MNAYFVYQSRDGGIKEREREIHIKRQVIYFDYLIQFFPMFELHMAWIHTQ